MLESEGDNFEIRENRMDELRAMRVFERVAGLHSFSAAAHELNMSNSATSRYVVDLENHLGARLLNRTTRRLGLTEIGKVYLERAREILDNIGELNAAMRNLDEFPSGTLRVTTAISLGQSFVVGLIPAFLKKFPDVSVELDMSTRLVDLVEEGYDLAIRVGSLDDSSMIQRHIFTSRVFLCATPAYCAKNSAPSKPGEVQNHLCILGPAARKSGRWTFFKGGQKTDIKISGRFVANTEAAIREGVLQDLGIGMLSDYSCQSDLQSGRLVQVMPDYLPPEYPTFAVYPHRKHLSAKVRSFIVHLSDASASTEPG